MTGPLYQPFYCEENVWHLASRAEALGAENPSAVFISSPARTVGMWAQRAGDPVVWDYHVVLIGDVNGVPTIWDLDTTAGYPLDLGAWLDASFPFSGVIPPELEPTFRIVSAESFLRDFRSDRSHMRNADGTWKAAPPPWPPLSEGHNLWEFVDPTGRAPGEVRDLAGMWQLARGTLPSAD